ncbi:MAG: GntR family transcriptional regulator [Pseudomonadota bacterium]
MSYRVEPIVREPAYLKVCQALEQDILDGTLSIGETLPTETMLADQFGVNRSTVREGVRLLEQTGLIVRGAAKRWVVTQVEAADVANNTSRALARSGVTFMQAWEALSVIYPQAAGLVAQRIDDQTLSRMKQRVADESKLNADQHDALVELVSEFFSDFAAAVDNPALEVSMESLNLLLTSSLRLILGGTPNALTRIVTAQKALIDAFSSGDQENARLWMTRHIGDLRRGYEVAGVDIRTLIVDNA